MTLLELIGTEYPVIRPLLLGVAITNIAFGVYVYRKNPKNLPNRMFAAFTTSITVWTLGLIFSRTANSPPILDRLAFLGGIMILPCILALFKSLPLGTTFHGQWDLAAFASSGVALAALSWLTPLIHVDSVIIDGRFHIIRGPLYPVLLPYGLSCYAACVASLWRRMRRTTGQARTQFQYLFLGFILPTAGGLTTNLILPSLWGATALNNVGPLLTLPMIVLITHAMVRHRLMDIRVVIRQGTVYALTGVVLATPAVVMVIAVGVWIPAVVWRVILDALVVGIVALLAAPLRNRLDRALNAYVYRERYNSHQILQDATQRLAQLRPLDALLADLSAVVDRALHPEAISIWLPALEGSGYRRAVGQDALPDRASGPPDFIPTTSALASWLGLHSNQPLLRDDSARSDNGWQPAVAELGNLGAELAVPISATRVLDGILLLGPKRSGDPYFDEDLSLLGALATQAAVALANERLHQDDLSRVKDLEAETRRVERLATLGAMASGIAHEIRNPLVAIKTHFQLMPEECTCGAQHGQRQFAAVATREIDRIDALLDRLTEMRDVPRASFAPIELSELLAETLFLLQAKLIHDSVTVVRELEPACVIRGDREQLKQLFLNLFGNAEESVGESGQIRVRCRVRRDHSRPTAIVEISDTGPGILEIVQETLFEPFVTTKRHGTGLGLALCRAIADVHRGTIRAENRVPGPGAVFTVEFPFEPTPL